MTSAHDLDRAALVALSGLPRMGPGRIRALLDGRPPSEVWAALGEGREPITAALEASIARPDRPAELLAEWTELAARTDAAEALACHRARGVAVLAPTDPGWPFTHDPDPPAVLFCLGDPGLLGPACRVAIVGTRRCSAYGVEVAGDLGAGLAAAGVPVVSGLAAGIDGAAHVGALAARAAPPVGVVATGLDVVYPRSHRQLWRRVAEAGVVVSEVPLGTPPTRWRFPARNRIIASLAAAVVVVESAARGGALHTVDEAVRRDRPVLAVPGPVTSRASSGTNRLLAEGALPACDLDDVLVAAGLAAAAAPAEHPSTVPTPHPCGRPGRVLDAVGWQPATFDQLVLRTGFDLGEVSVLLRQLEADGFVRLDGGWVERRR